MSEAEKLCKILRDYEERQLRRAVLAYTRSPETFLDEVDTLEVIIDARRKVCAD